MPIRLNGPGRIRKCADGLQNTLDEFRALLMARDTSLSLLLGDLSLCWLSTPAKPSMRITMPGYALL